MKILFLSHRTPYPPNKGTQVRPHALIKALTARGHDVHLVAFAEGEKELGAQKNLEDMCASATLIPFHRRWAQLKAMATILTPRALSLGHFSSRALRKAVDRIVRDKGIEAAVVWSSSMAQFVPDQLASRTVIDMGDVDSEKWRDYAPKKTWPMSLVYRTEYKRLRQYEYDIIHKFAHTVLITQREIALLDKLDEFTRHSRLHAITNGVDIERFHPDTFPAFAPEALPAGEKQFLSDPQAIRVVFTGAMDYFPNVEAACYFAQEVFPHIRARQPRAEFLIVGSDPAPDVVRLGKLPNVRVTGWVNDVRPYLAAATVCVTPLAIARGVQNKALEAMAMARPLVATPEVAAGVQAIAGEHLLVARDTREYIDMVMQVINDNELRARLGTEARQFVEENCQWKPLMDRLATLIEESAGRARGSAVTKFPREFTGR
ncbi:MAG: TIGR03087 family PEP-CTERM/XrtA system glycosyltransferase [Blastocatellia bacterium]